MFFQLGISCKLGKRKNGTGGRQEIFIREKEMFCAVWNKISSMQSDVSTTEFWRPKDEQTSVNETVPTGVCGMPHTPVGTVDGRNMQTRSMWMQPEVR